MEMPTDRFPSILRLKQNYFGRLADLIPGQQITSFHKMNILGQARKNRVRATRYGISIRGRRVGMDCLIP